jgi:vacuolar-type H+-ATPase subunit I/STV1
MEDKPYQQSHLNDTNESELRTENGISNDQHREYINKRENEHRAAINALAGNFNEKLVAALLAKDIAHASELEKQKDELDSERAEHEATKQELNDALGELDTMRQEKDTHEQTVNELCARAEEAVDAKQETINALERDLSIFRGIDSAQALADHITYVQGFIDRLSEKLASMSFNGELDGRSHLQIKDLRDSLMLKRVDNYTSVFLSEQACIMGYTFSTNELGAIGGPVAKRVREEGVESMSKHTRFVNGMIVQVNSYSEASRDIINDELRKAWNKKQARA